MANNVYIINSAGEREVFSLQKVYRSARMAGASKRLALEIAKVIEKEAFPGIKTIDIYRRVRKMLAKENFKSGLRFSLKRAIKKLGPTGFPFEKYIGEIFKQLGFSVKINQFLPGGCVSGYEIDFLARKGDIMYIGECKYRNFAGERVHSRDALYNYARFLDILNGRLLRYKEYSNCVKKTIIVTNTKFTARAKQYSRCVGMELFGWKEPKGNGLEYIIEQQKFYPITILPSLRSRVKDAFVSKKMMLAQDVLRINPKHFAKKFNVPISNLEALIREAKILLEE